MSSSGCALALTFGQHPVLILHGMGELMVHIFKLLAHILKFADVLRNFYETLKRFFLLLLRMMCQLPIPLSFLPGRRRGSLPTDGELSLKLSRLPQASVLLGELARKERVLGKHALYPVLLD